MHQHVSTLQQLCQGITMHEGKTAKWLLQHGFGLHWPQHSRTMTVCAPVNDPVPVQVDLVEHPQGLCLETLQHLLFAGWLRAG
jgi:hypothetical protein